MDSLEKKNVFEKQLKLLDLFSPEKRRLRRGLMVADSFLRRRLEGQEVLMSSLATATGSEGMAWICSPRQWSRHQAARVQEVLGQSTQKYYLIFG